MMQRVPAPRTATPSGGAAPAVPPRQADAESEDGAEGDDGLVGSA